MDFKGSPSTKLKTLINKTKTFDFKGRTWFKKTPQCWVFLLLGGLKGTNQNSNWPTSNFVFGFWVCGVHLVTFGRGYIIYIYIHTYTPHTHYIHISADPWRIAFVLSWNTSGRSSAGQRPENHPWPLRYWRGEITGDGWTKICKYVKHGKIFPKALGKPCLNICSIYIMIYHELCHVHYLGEASGGVHGDNRLAGNSLLECLLAERGGVDVVTSWSTLLMIFPCLGHHGIMIFTCSDVLCR